MIKALNIQGILLTYNKNKILHNYVDLNHLKLAGDNISTFLFEVTEKEITLELLTIIEKNILNVWYWGLVNYENSKDSGRQTFRSIDRNNSIQTKAFAKLLHRVRHLSPYHVTALLGDTFTINELYDLYKVVTTEVPDKGNFHKLIKNQNFIEPIGKYKEGVSYRPPELYTFSKNFEDIPIFFG